MAERRASWKLWQLGIAPQRLVFLDETGVKTNMVCSRGRSLEGTRLVCDVPHGHWKTTTFLAALRVTGLTAPLVIDGAINGELFRGRVQQHLVPTLSPGDIVVMDNLVMDNLASHKVAGVRSAIERAGAKVAYLPPYSPDLNPIETVFSKFKWFVKSAARRTVDGLWSVCAQASHLFQEPEAETTSATPATATRKQDTL